MKSNRLQQNLDTFLVWSLHKLVSLILQVSHCERKKFPLTETLFSPVSDDASCSRLGTNALQRLIRKMNWPEMYWSCRQSVSPAICLTLSPSFTCKHSHGHTLTYIHAHPPVLFHVTWGCRTLRLKERKKHLCICLCGWSPAWGLLGFSEVCCDLTRPLTGGTVNIRLSCDSHCGLKEPTKGQCFLMPLPTTKWSDFISCSCICPILGDGYIGGVASHCSYIVEIFHISTGTHTHAHRDSYISTSVTSRRRYIWTKRHTIRHVAHTTSGFVFIHVMSDGDSRVLTHLHNFSHQRNYDPCSSSQHSAQG